MKKTASAIWQGGLKDGKGLLSTESGALKQNPYGFNTRFEGSPGTNPEELIAWVTQARTVRFTPDRIDTAAEVTLDKQADGFAITAVHLVLRAKVPGASEAQFLQIADKAKAGCPVSKVLNAKISLDAALVG